MTSKFTELAIGCADPGGLARFWCSVLDYEVQDEDDGIVTIGSPMAPEGKNRAWRRVAVFGVTRGLSHGHEHPAFRT